MNLQDLLKEIGTEVIKTARENLIAKNKNASGSLSSSLGYIIDNNKLTFQMSSYGTIVNDGRRPGKYVPVDALNAWLKEKNISLKFSFVINRAIKNKGIKPTFFFTTAYEKTTEDLEQIVDGYIEWLLEDKLK